jgi:hypothetical protein
MRASWQILFAAVPLALWGAWTIWSLFVTVRWMDIGFWIEAALGCAALAAFVGVLMLRDWAKYLYYSMAVIFSASWAYWVWQSIGDEWPYADPILTVISLLPGVLLLCAWAGGSYVVHRQYRRVA